MKRLFSSIIKSALSSSSVTLDKSINSISELLKLKIPARDFRQYEYEHKLPKLVKSVFKWFDIINEDLLNVSYEIIDEGEYISNYRYSPTYLRIFKINGHIKIFRESGKLEFEDEFKVTLRIPRIVNKYFFIINGAKYIPSLHFTTRPVIYLPNKISFFVLGFPLTLNIQRVMNLFSESYSHLTSIYILILLYDPFRSKEAYKNFIEFLYMNLPFDNHKINTYTYKSDLQKLFKKIESELLRYKEKFTKVFRMFTPEIDYDPTKNFQKFIDDILTAIYLKHPYNRAILAADLGIEYIKNVSNFSQIIRDIIDKKILTFEFTEDMNYGKLYNRRVSIYEPLFSLLNREILNYIFSVVNTTTHKVFNIPDNYFERVLFSKRPFNLNLYDIATPYDAILGHKFINFDGDEDKTLLEYRIPNETYLGRICLVSTSSQKPGIDMHVVPNTTFNYFGYVSDLYEPRFTK